MTDIVNRLRAEGKDAFAKQYSLGMWKLCAEAADEIERLRANTSAPGSPLWRIDLLCEQEELYTRDELVTMIRRICAEPHPRSP